MRSTASPTRIIAEFVVNTGYGNLPDNAIQIARMSIIDGIGTCIAGA
jgi:2-methylcitrate dehydratase PrpD